MKEQQRIRDEERYGPPAERRRGRIQVTKALFLHGRLPLPRMTRVVDMRLNESDTLVFDLIVESPDIPPPAEDGTLPLLKFDVSWRPVSKDRAVPHLSIVEYIAVAEWKGMPDTKAATPMFGGIAFGDLSPSRALLRTALDEGQSDRHSPALEAMREVGWTSRAQLTGKMYGCNSWAERVATLDEVQARKMLATMLASFWGGF